MILPLVLGLIDGILTALALAAARLTNAGEGLTIGLGLRIASVALVSGALAFFVARYAELRGELRNAERQLNLAARGRFVTGKLGTAILRESLASAAVSSAAAFCGALVPLLPAGLFPHERWLALAVGTTTLAALGAGLGYALNGNPWRWALALAAAAVIVTIIGAFLKVVA